MLSCSITCSIINNMYCIYQFVIDTNELSAVTTSINILSPPILMQIMGYIVHTWHNDCNMCFHDCVSLFSIFVTNFYICCCVWRNCCIINDKICHACTAAIIYIFSYKHKYNYAIDMNYWSIIQLCVHFLFISCSECISQCHTVVWVYHNVLKHAFISYTFICLLLDIELVLLLFMAWAIIVIVLFLTC